MSSTFSPPPPPPGNDGRAAATKAHEAYLEKIGLGDVLKQGIAQLLKLCPRPASRKAAWRVLSAQITQDIDAQVCDGESKDATAAETTISVFVETQVRSPVLE